MNYCDECARKKDLAAQAFRFIQQCDFCKLHTLCSRADREEDVSLRKMQRDETNKANEGIETGWGE